MNKEMNKEILEMSAQMVICDAIEKGHTNKSQMVEYMDTEVFRAAVMNYYKKLSSI